MCITCTIMKVNIFPISQFGVYYLILSNLHSLNQIGDLIDFMIRRYRMLVDICNLYHLFYGLQLWFWSAASSMLFIRIYGIQMLLLSCLCNVLLQYLHDAEYWAVTLSSKFVVAVHSISEPIAERTTSYPYTKRPAV